MQIVYNNTCGQYHSVMSQYNYYGLEEHFFCPQVNPIASSSLVAVWREKPLTKQLSEITHQSVFADAIRSNPADAIQMIIDQSGDNYKMVEDIVGEKLLKRIITSQC